LFAQCQQEATPTNEHVLHIDVDPVSQTGGRIKEVETWMVKGIGKDRGGLAERNQPQLSTIGPMAGDRRKWKMPD